MKTHVIYLYEYTANSSLTKINEITYCKKTDLYPIVALDNNMYASTPIRQAIIKKLSLKPIEIWQENFDLFIKKSEILGIDLMTIEFTDDVDDELRNDLKKALFNRNYKKAFILVKIIKNDNIDISSLTLIHETNRYRITRHAIVEVTGENFPDALSKLEKSPLLFILGLLKFPN